MSRNLLHSNDIRFAEFAGTLSDADWSRPSLCTEWTNHEVLAHLVLGYRSSLTSLVVAVTRQRGSFDRANTRLAADLAQQRSPAELIDDFASLTDRPRGVGRVFPRRLLLGDHVIHELDIAFALGRPAGVAGAALRAVLDTQVRVPNPFVPAAALARGLNLYAAEIDWAYGSGDHRVSGGGAEIASALAGRPRALDQLTGAGVELLRARVSAGTTGSRESPSAR